MIFLSVGSQTPFDRLIREVDAWAGARGRSDVVAQVGASDYAPRHLRAVPFLEPAAFEQHVRSASALVSHAGTGTILAALSIGKPLLVFPRRAALRETRNDHQVPTARHFAESGRVLAAYDEADLWAALDRIESFTPPDRIEDGASPELLERIRRFIVARV